MTDSYKEVETGGVKELSRSSFEGKSIEVVSYTTLSGMRVELRSCRMVIVTAEAWLAYIHRPQDTRMDGQEIG